MKINRNIVLVFIFFCNFTLIGEWNSNDYQLEVLDYNSIKLNILEIATMLSDTYQGYPYFFETSIHYEIEYIEEVLTKSNLIFIVLKNNTEIIGFTFGLPLVFGEGVFFIDDILHVMKKSFDYKDYFYLSEIVIKKSYQNKRLARPLLASFYKEVKKQGFMKICAAVIENDNASKDIEYKPHNQMWERLGFTKTDLLANIEWDTLVDKEGNVQLLQHKVGILTNEI